MEEIKNLRKVAERIKRAIKDKERIILYADADLDGTASLLILEEAIKNLGGEVSAVYFPDRQKEGYGLSRKALSFLKKYSPALLILLDCGISNFDEIEKANKMDFEVIVIDHHKVLGKLPKASIIVDPKQKGDKYSFKELCTAALSYYLSESILGNKLQGLLKQSFLELVAIATLADMMVEKEDNKNFVRKGISTLFESFRPGIKIFSEISLEKPNSERELAFRIVSNLSAGEVRDHLTDIYRILKENDLETVEILAKDLMEKNIRKHQEIERITQEIKERLEEKGEEEIVFEGDSSWPVAFLGPVATKIQSIFRKPTFIYFRGNKESRGAVRVPKGVDSVEAMRNCDKFLKTYGGHPPASGFSIKNENLLNFKDCLVKYFSKNECKKP